MGKDNWIKQAINRCKAETPRVFRKVQYVAGALSAAAIAINAECMNMGVVLPEWWNSLIPYAIGFSTGLVALSQFTQRYDTEGKPIYKTQES